MFFFSRLSSYGYQYAAHMIILTTLSSAKRTLYCRTALRIPTPNGPVHLPGQCGIGTRATAEDNL